MLWENKNISQMKDILKEKNNEMSSRVACFTGHRPQKLPWKFDEEDERCVKIKRQTKMEIENTICRGYHTFICGMSLGFDMICAEIVLELKTKYPHIKLVGAIPCKDQSRRWSRDQQNRYKKLIRKLDEIRCIYKKYKEGCMQERNQFMINNSSLVIALFDGLSGGTKATIDYANKQGKKVVIIRP